MSLATDLKHRFRPGGAVRRTAASVRDGLAVAHTLAASVDERVIRPKPKALYVSLTADCNFRCAGCHYGRDFMAGHQLPWEVGEPLLEDAKETGFRTIRLYGGEPLLHRDLPRYVEKIDALGLDMWLTTNGLLLSKKIDALVAAGLRRLSIGFYGLGDEYDRYVARRGAFRVVERAIRETRERHPDLPIHLDFLLMRPTSGAENVGRIVEFARTHGLRIYVNLVHYSLPYFVKEVGEANLSFDERDRALLEETAEAFIAAKRADPMVMRNTVTGLRSIPDWLILKERMRVPCSEHEMVWIGADGTVQMCYVQFPLGNLHEARLRDMVGGEAHVRAVRDAFKLRCANCHCGYDKRVRRSLPARLAYG